jgi:hypothetical protein
MAPELAAEKHIFHEPQWRKASELIKQPAAQEQALIAVRQPRQPDAGGRATVDEPVQPGVGANRHPEAPRRHAPLPKQSIDFGQGAVLQGAIGVQEQQRLSRGMGGAEVHLPGAAARPVQPYVGFGSRRPGAIAAAAVHDKDFMRPLPPQQLERLCQAAYFVESRYDNRDAHG